MIVKSYEKKEHIGDKFNKQLYNSCVKINYENIL